MFAGGGINLGKILGVQLKIHWSFFLIFLFILLDEKGQINTDNILSDSIFIIGIFICVVLHEFGHSLAARGYGIKTHQILLLPIGGVAQLERMPSKPKQELWVAIAGPLVNVAIFLILAPLLIFLYPKMRDLSLLSTPQSFWGDILFRLTITNLILIVFNLLPVFPMDGGRVTRAIMSMFMGHLKATFFATRLGQVLAVVGAFLAYQYLDNQMLIFTAIFLIISAENELRYTRTKAIKEQLTVGQIMDREYLSMLPNQTIKEAIELSIGSDHKAIIVVAQYQPIGIVYTEDLIPFLETEQLSMPISSIMKTDFSVAQENDLLQPTINKITSGECIVIPVMDGNFLTGILSKWQPLPYFAS